MRVRDQGSLADDRLEGVDFVILRGPAGPAGDTGPDGKHVGPQGPMGHVGPMGPNGDKGPIGEQGPQGPQGPVGDIGPIGDTGPQGDPGDKGPIGPQGDKGPQGITGLMGDKGLTGLRGIKGPRGDQGLKGLQGPQGITGDKGPTGSAGLFGPMGDKGPQGDVGIQGDKGRSGVIVESWLPCSMFFYLSGNIWTPVCTPMSSLSINTTDYPQYKRGGQTGYLISEQYPGRTSNPNPALSGNINYDICPTPIVFPLYVTSNLLPVRFTGELAYCISSEAVQINGNYDVPVRGNSNYTFKPYNPMRFTVDASNNLNKREGILRQESTLNLSAYGNNKFYGRCFIDRADVPFPSDSDRTNVYTSTTWVSPSNKVTRTVHNLGYYIWFGINYIRFDV